MGSQTPWIELILLNKGAKKVTTFDYVKMKSERPEVEVLTPGVNFTNILRAAFTLVGPKSAKRF